jgi:pimeloyl-ACP methyl ester carboxylesterase
MPEIGQYVRMAPPPVTETVRLGDDRGEVLAVERALVPGMYPLLVHSGSPGSRRLRPRQVGRAAEAGFCLVSYDRPGYGDSSPGSGREVANAADDVATIADGFAYSELAVWGFSGGGPFALASAAILPAMVRACCVIASLAPREPFGTVWAEAWPASTQAQVELFFTDRPGARELFRSEAEEAFSRFSSPAAWLDRWGSEAGQDEAHSSDMATYRAMDVACSFLTKRLRGQAKFIFRHSGALPQPKHRSRTTRRPRSHASSPSKSLGRARRSVLCWPLLAHAEKAPQPSPRARPSGHRNAPSTSTT